MTISSLGGGCNCGSCATCSAGAVLASRAQVSTAPTGNAPGDSRATGAVGNPSDTATAARRRTDAGPAAVSFDVTDRVELSARATESLDAAEGQQQSRPLPEEEAPQSSEQRGGPNELTDEEQQQVEELQARDREVRAHEQAHLAAAGQYATGGPTYSYQRGPDGRNYAVGGQVSIDTSPIEGDPEATVAKMQQVRAAALAPAEPSGQDLSVASQAQAAIAQAQAEIASSAAAEARGEGEGAEGGGGVASAGSDGAAGSDPSAGIGAQSAADAYRVFVDAGSRSGEAGNESGAGGGATPRASSVEPTTSGIQQPEATTRRPLDLLG